MACNLIGEKNSDGGESISKGQALQPALFLSLISSDKLSQISQNLSQNGTSLTISNLNILEFQYVRNGVFWHDNCLVFIQLNIRD